MDMHPTTLQAAKRYGVTREDLMEFAADYGYTFHGIEHRKSPYTKAIDYVVVVPERWARVEENLFYVEVQIGNCFQCGERCVAYGWEQGGVHTTTCSCKSVDFS